MRRIQVDRRQRHPPLDSPLQLQQLDLQIDRLTQIRLVLLQLSQLDDLAGFGALGRRGALGLFLFHGLHSSQCANRGAICSGRSSERSKRSNLSHPMLRIGPSHGTDKVLKTFR